MKTKKSLKNHGLNIGVVMASALALASSQSFAQADALSYETGFEPPSFEPGLLHGQDEWETLFGPAEISYTSRESGQSIKIFGQFLVPYEGLLRSWNRRLFEYDGYDLGTPVVDIAVDSMLEGEETGEDLVSTNLLPAVDGWFLGSAMYLSSSGDVWVCAADPDYSCDPTVPVDVGEYHRLGIRTDYETRMSQFFVNGDMVAKHPIGSWVPPDLFFYGLRLDLVAVEDPNLVNPSDYKGYFDNLSINAYRPFPFDIKPSSCPNPLNVKSRGVLPVAILGTEELDVGDIDPESVQLVIAQGGGGIQPLRWSMEDVATPYEPFTGKENADDCNELGPDGYTDLTLKFDTQEVVDNLGAVNDQEVRLITFIGKLKDEVGGTSIIGEDFVRIK